jgi:hypothetical protein
LLTWPSVLRFVEDLEVGAPRNASAAARVAWVYDLRTGATLSLADGGTIAAENIPHHPRPYINVPSHGR